MTNVFPDFKSEKEAAAREAKARGKPTKAPAKGDKKAGGAKPKAGGKDKASVSNMLVWSISLCVFRISWYSWVIHQLLNW